MKKFSYLILVMTLFLCLAGNAWGASSTKAIYQFSFTYSVNPQLVCNMMGIVDESAKTIFVNVPYGTDVTILKPTIYTTSIKSPTSSRVSPASGAVQDFSSPVVYTCYAEDNSTQEYTVTVVPVSNTDKAITQFKFNNPLTSGTINEGAKTIAVNVPYGTIMDPNNDAYGLFATISIAGASVIPTPGNGFVDYRVPVTYTVTAGDNSTQAYTVTVTAYSQTSPVYVDKTWAGNAIGTEVESGKIYGYNAFSTIQKGIIAVTYDGTVNVAAGTYAEAVSVNKAITLQGAGSGTTIIQPTAGANAITINNSGSSGNVAHYIFDNIQLLVSGTAQGILAGDLSYISIEMDNSIINYSELGGKGILFGTSGGSTTGNNISVLNSTIQCTATVNSDYSKGIAWYMSSASTLTVTNSTITSGHYAIRTQCPGLAANISGTTLHGYAALNLNDNAATFNISNSTLIGRTFWSSGGENDYGTIAFQDAAYNEILNITNSTIKNEYAGSASSWEALFAVSGHSNRVNLDAATQLINTNWTYAPLCVNATKGDFEWYVNSVQQNPVGVDLYVNATTGDDAISGEAPVLAKKTIQSAVTAAVATNVINVAAGTYNESITITKPLTLNGANYNKTANDPARGAESIVYSVVDADENTFYDVAVLIGSLVSPITGITTPTTLSGSVTIAGFVLAPNPSSTIPSRKYANRGTEDNGVYINTTGSSVTIKNTIIQNYWDNGFRIIGGTAIIQDNNIIGRGSRSDYSGDGIRVDNTNACNITISGNTITNNLYIPTDGVSAGLSLNYGATVTASDNSVYDNAYGVHIKGGSAAGHAVNITANNNSLYNNITKNFYYEVISGGSPLTAYNATCNWYGTAVASEVAAKISGNVDFLPCKAEDGDCDVMGPVVNVTNDPQTSYVTIQSAINAATAGDVIEVAAGTYKESNILVNKSLTIQGIGATRDDVIVAPSANDSQTNTDFGGTAQHGFTVVANGVTIKDLTIDGDANNIANGGTLINQHNFRTGIITISSTLAGPYNNLTVQNVIVRNAVLKGISLSNTSSAGHLISGSWIENIAIKHGIYSQAADVTITGNTIRGTGMGILFSTSVTTPSSKTTTITNNTLYDIAGSYSSYYNGTGWPTGAIYYRNPNIDETVIITGNTLTIGNGAEVDSPGACGMYIYNTDANSLIEDNTINTLSGTNNTGIYLGGSAGTTINENTFTMNESDCGIYLGRGVAGIAVPNVISNNTFTSDESTSSAIGEGVAILMSNDGDVFWMPEIPYNTNNIITGNTITGFQRGIVLNEKASGTNVQPGSTVEATINNNKIIGSIILGLEASTLTNGTAVDATCNWWGTNVPSTVASNISGNVQFLPFSTLASPLNCSGVGPVTVSDPASSYMTIQGGINGANSGATITVAAGTYKERFTITKSLTINGAKAGVDARTRTFTGESILDGTGLTGAPYDAIKIANGVSNVTIDGFEITNYVGSGSNGDGNAISSYCMSSNTTGASNITVQNNYIHDVAYNGILVGSENATATNMVIQSGWLIQKNKLSGFKYAGIEFTNVTNSQVKDNVISAPTSIFDDPGDAGVGIEIAARSRAKAVTTNTIEVSGNTITGTFPTGSRAAINLLSRSYTDADANATLSNITVSGNSITGATNVRAAILAVAESRTKPSTINTLAITNNTLDGNLAGIEIQDYINGGGSTASHSGITITSNNVKNNTGVGLHIMSSTSATGITITENSFLTNTLFGIKNEGTGTLTATNNWWGDASGPHNTTSNDCATGDDVSNNVTYTPWWYNAEMTKPWPGTQDATITVTNIKATKADISWKRTAGTGSFVVVKLATDGSIGDPDDLPVDCTIYDHFHTNFTSAHIIKTGRKAKVVQYGPSTVCYLTGLTRLTTYYVRVCNYQGEPDAGTAQYNRASNLKTFATPRAKEAYEGTDALAGTFSLGLIAPNPVTDNLNFALEVTDEQAFTIEVYDAEGKTVNQYCTNQIYGSGTHNININMNNVSSGLYTLVVKSGMDMAFTQFIIAK
ncbi:MAG: right-handed parallel beta-helix repeat-containing protein [bacterium]